MESKKLSPTDLLSVQFDYELFLLNQEIDTPSDNPNHQDTHVSERQGQEDFLIHATDLSHNFALPQFMAQHNCEDLKPIDTPSTFSTFTQTFSDHTSNQILDHLEAVSNEDNEISDDLYKFSALTVHQEPLKAMNPNWKGCKYKVFIEWETGEKTYEPVSILAADNPVTCATYTKTNDLLHADGWKRFRNLAKRDKILTKAVMQPKIR